MRRKRQSLNSRMYGHGSVEHSLRIFLAKSKHSGILKLGTGTRKGPGFRFQDRVISILKRPGHNHWHPAISVG